MQPLSKTYLTPEEYLALERQAETKSEYLRGEVFAMSGASRQHVTIMVNTIACLVTRLKGRPCTVYGSDLRVKVAASGLYTYPDVVVVCGKAQFEDRHQDTLLNPTVIMEILSPSTESYDRGAKFAHYRLLDSLSDYLLIAQASATVEHYARQPDGKWLLSTFEGLQAVVPLPSIGVELPLADLYDKIEWPGEVLTSTSLRLLREPAAHYTFDETGHALRPGPPDWPR